MNSNLLVNKQRRKTIDNLGAENYKTGSLLNTIEFPSSKVFFLKGKFCLHTFEKQKSQLFSPNKMAEKCVNHDDKIL